MEIKDGSIFPLEPEGNLFVLNSVSKSLPFEENTFQSCILKCMV